MTIAPEKSRADLMNLFLREIDFARLTKSAIGAYKILPMAQDASLRSYYRVQVGTDKSFVLMDCPPDYQPLGPFIKMSVFLRDNGFIAPRIIAHDVENGFLLIEDFGSISLKQYIHEQIDDRDSRMAMYRQIIDLLVDLHKVPIAESELEIFDNQSLYAELEVFQWYSRYALPGKFTDAHYNEFLKIWRDLLGKQVSMDNVVLLRDYHVENMMYLGGRGHGTIDIGLLDFQDARLGSPVYDLVSVLEDARCDVERDEALELLEYFSIKSGLDLEDVLLNYHILGAQRNLRILGVFARKLSRDGNNSYIRYLPRVKRYLSYDLSHPDLGELGHFMRSFL
jgi:aminoglycoside/choline kinase family phosphotransferase